MEVNAKTENAGGSILAKPSQAVILAGGLGTRLLPYTKDMPKPMIPFHGRPFLEYLTEMLREQGITRVLMLLGYMPEVIQRHFGDGSDRGMRIEYSVTPVSDETGSRLRAAIPQIDQHFLLMYCDNYWPMNLERMWQSYQQHRCLGMITTYNNTDAYTRSNIRVSADKLIEVYDKSRTSSGLQGVDIGFALLNREVLDLIPEGNVSFEASVYPLLIAGKQLAAYTTDHRYYSIGSIERLPITEEFLARRPTVILDRDGVLNRKPPRAEYVRSWQDWRWLPGAPEAVGLLRSRGYRVLLATNQAGIARGQMTAEDLDSIHKQMNQDLRKFGGEVDEVFYCPHGWDEGCECRKPRAGLLFQAQREYHLDLSRTLFIGDDERDLEAGIAAGCPTILLNDQQTLLDLVKQQLA